MGHLPQQISPGSKFISQLGAYHLGSFRTFINLRDELGDNAAITLSPVIETGSVNKENLELSSLPIKTN